MWKQWINFILGLLVILGAWMGNWGTTVMVILGIIIALLALWAGLEKKK